MKGDWYVYLVRGCDHSLFAGATDDVLAEVERLHAGTGSPYGWLKGPVRLAYWERLATKRAAQARAIALRKLPKHHKEFLVLGRRGAQLWKWDQIGGPQALGAMERR